MILDLVPTRAPQPTAQPTDVNDWVGREWLHSQPIWVVGGTFVRVSVCMHACVCVSAALRRKLVYSALLLCSILVSL